MALDKIPTLRDFLTILFKHKWNICILFLTIVLSVTVLTYVWPFSYEASAKILVKFDRSKASLSGSLATPKAVMTMRGTEEEILSEIEILNNTYLIKKVVDHFWDDLTRVGTVEPQTLWQKIKSVTKKVIGKIFDLVMDAAYMLGLTQQIGPYDSQVAGMQKNLEIVAVKDSNVIEVKYRSGSPELSAAVVNKLTELYLEHHITVHKVLRARDFFATQKDIFGKELKSKEESIEGFKQMWDITSITLQRKLSLENIAELSREHNHLIGQIRELEQTVVSMNNELAKRTNYLREDDISMASISADSISTLIRQRSVINKSTLEGLRARLEVLEVQLESYNDEIRVFAGKELELQRMERDLSILEDNYRRYLGRLEDTRIDEALDMAHISNVSIIEPATVPFSSIRRISFLPRRVFHLSVGIIIGLIVAIAYAFLAEYLDHTFSSSEQVERMLKIQCLSTIRKE